MMRENDQTQRMKTQTELIPERKTPTTNVPLMAMTPISATVTTSNTSSAYFKDLTSTLFEQKPSQPISSMSNSQTMPSLILPTMIQQQPKRPMVNTNDLTASLLNNMNSFAPRPQTNSMNSYSGITSGGGGLFQPPPPGSTVVKGVNVTKTAAAELDDLFN